MESFVELMNRYEKKVFNFCLRYLGNQEEAEEAAQDVFIKIYTKGGTFKWKSSFSTWLYSVTANTCANYSRKLKPKINKEISMHTTNESAEFESAFDPRSSEPGPDKIYQNKELGEIIRRSLSKLRQKQKSVLILKDFMGKTYEEISEILNMRVGTVKSTLSRGRLILAKEIKEYYQR
jgi:RNA polymerase sigma-70 factor (ECF subfamily)